MISSHLHFSPVLVKPLRWCLTWAAMAVTSCKQEHKSPELVSLFQQPLLGHWHRVESLQGTGLVSLEKGAITLHAGSPMTAAQFAGWEQLHLPVTNYEISFEAQRLEGQDFFAALTFPIHRLDTCATLVLGGWGGALVGISSIDGQDASENSTRSEQRFINGQWYGLRLRITDEDLMAWLDGRLIINTSLKARKISLRMGDIETCAPFGLATFGTTGKVRNLVLSAL